MRCLVALGLWVAALGCSGSPATVVKPPPDLPAADPLDARHPIEREISPGQIHRYRMQLAPTQVLVGAAEQRGADVVVTVLDPNGIKLFEGDSPNANDGPEPFAIEAEHAGEYRIEITTFAPPGGTPSAGRYELHAEVLTGAAFAELRAREMIHSPRLLRLWRDLYAQRPASVEEFWGELAGKAPLVEPIAGSSDVLVSFVYRLEDPKLFVTVYGGPTAREKPMSRLADTDVLYLTARMPGDARFSYSFVAKPYPLDFQDDYLAPGHRVARRAGIADPLNPHSEAGRSVVELPDAPTQPWIEVQGVAAGTVTPLTIDSAELHEPRLVGVYTPAGFDPKLSYPLVVVFDGEWYGLDDVAQIPTPRILDNLIAAGKIPPVVAALVANQGTRNRDLTASLAFSSFVALELVPKLRQDYSAGATPETTIVAGSSYGGLCGTFTALEHADVIGNVLSQSGAFHFVPGGEKNPLTYATDHTWLMQRYARSPRLPIRFYLDVGRFETDSVFFELLGANRHMRDVLEAKGYEITYSELDGGHDAEVWRGTLADGLIALLAR